MAPGTWAATAHLPYLLASPKYQVVAVCNSTAQSAQASIDHHKLGSSVAAYGSPEALAADPNVDLIVVTVQVGKHYALTKPALLAGKDVYVEWPLGVTTAESVELTKLAESKGVKTIVGVQARANPLVTKVKELVAGGKLGNVLSSSVVGALTGAPIGIWLAGAEYYLDINSGGNSLMITFGHCASLYFPTTAQPLLIEDLQFSTVSFTSSAISPSCHRRSRPLTQTPPSSLQKAKS